MEISNTKKLSIIQLFVTSFTIGMYFVLAAGYYSDAMNSWYAWPNIAHNLTIGSLLLMPFFITTIGIAQITSSLKEENRTKLSMAVAISGLFSYIPFALLIPFILNALIIFTSIGSKD